MPYKSSLNDMRELAKAKGGKCLSTEYVNGRTKLIWECAEGHTWETCPENVKGTKNRKGSWCLECSGNKRLTIEEMHKLAAERGGKCLSDKYVNSATKLKWECRDGHVWEATQYSIRAGGWCAECAGKKKLTIELMHQIAAERGGKCLSKDYTNIWTPLEWECSEGHRWKQTPHQIRNKKSWCRLCMKNIYFYEELCRTTFEQLFNIDFPKSRPKWLKNPRNQSLELDGYSESLGIAFEYNGEQHYLQDAYHNRGRDLSNQKARDSLKKELCETNNVHLFIISYKDDLTQLPQLIENRSKALDLDTANIDFAKDIDFNKVYLHRPKIEKMHEIANARGGTCLSTKYVGNKNKLKWMCSEGHVWEAVPNNVLSNETWCKECAGNARLELKEMQKIAELRGGKCLSTEYVNGRTKLIWECAEGHTWKASPTHVKNSKSWCLICSGRAIRTIEEMNAFAKKKGGKCLSTVYKNIDSKLKWACAEGHIWEQSAYWILNSHIFCSLCERSEKILQKAKNLSEDRNGKCLSSGYVTPTDKLEFMCSERHVWETRLKNIQRGTWCRKCYEKSRKKTVTPKKGTIIEMQEIARERGGRCLSNKYVNAQTKLEWMCSEGHTWEQTPYNVKNRNTWCKACFIVKRKAKM
jgi:hypothetical protein